MLGLIRWLGLHTCLEELKAMNVICPRCGKPMIKKTEKGRDNGPNGGWLCVMEDMGNHAIEGYDFEIEMWRCEDCKATAYISEGQG